MEQLLPSPEGVALCGSVPRWLQASFELSGEARIALVGWLEQAQSDLTGAARTGEGEGCGVSAHGMLGLFWRDSRSWCGLGPVAHWGSPHRGARALGPCSDLHYQGGQGA